MEIKKLINQPKEITPVFIEAVLMPNGEVICFGKTIGWYDSFERPIYERA